MTSTATRFVKGRFNPVPEVGDLILGDGLNNVSVTEVYDQGSQREWEVECSDGQTRSIVPMWHAKDEEAGTVEANHWWQDCMSKAVPWFE